MGIILTLSRADCSGIQRQSSPGALNELRRMASLLFLITLFSLSTSLQAAAPNGLKILESRCQSCHNLTGPAPDTLAALWSRKGPDLFYAASKYRQAWLEQWLQAPKRIRPAGMFYGNHLKENEEHDQIDESTLSPHVSLSAKEAKAVAKLLMTFKTNSKLINPGEYKDGGISLQLGDLLFEKFRGCIGCHRTSPEFGGLSGPEVYTVAKRLQNDYMISYMRDPQAWDPLIFMPNKHLKEVDLQKFVRYFNALSKEDFDEDDEDDDDDSEDNQ